MFLKIHLFQIDRGRRGFQAGGSGGLLGCWGGQGGDTGPVYFNNNSQTHGLSSRTLNETLGLRWNDKTHMLKRGFAWVVGGGLGGGLKKPLTPTSLHYRGEGTNSGPRLVLYEPFYGIIYVYYF